MSALEIAQETAFAMQGFASVSLDGLISIAV